jgi:pullulanase
VLEIDISGGDKEILYKYTIQSFSNENPWSKVEKGANGEEISNRKVVISKNTEKVLKVEDKVAMFNEYSSNSTVVGNLDIFTMTMTSLNKTRKIRVWTPSSYDPNGTKRYPVLYMHDGQNLFDKYTSFAGEWGIDESIEALIESKGIDGFIVVGIDNGSDRMIEYTPNWGDTPEMEGGKYGEFIINELKPHIDKNYLTLKDRENTMIGGSSMGGLISFYIGLKYKDTFGHILAMSSSFHRNTIDARQEFINSLTLENLPKLYLDSGYPKDNSEYVDVVKAELINKGYPESLIYTRKVDSHTHSEASWQKRFPEAISWLFNIK